MATSVIDIDAPISWTRDLMTLSDLVANGVVTAVNTRLNADQSEVLTEYTVALKRCSSKDIQTLSRRRDCR